MDLVAARTRLAALKNANNRTSHIWKPEPGKHVIRIVPYVHNPENVFIELYFHYNLGKKSTLSPVSFGRPDPIVEFAEKLKQTGDKTSWIQGRKLEPKMRTYVPVLIRGHEKEGVKFWGFGKQLYQELLEIISDPEYGDITDINSGHDIQVIVKSAEEAGKNFAETNILMRPSKTPVSKDDDILEKIKDQPNITELYPEPTYEDLAVQLKTWMGSKDESDDGSDETEITSSTSKNNSTKTEVEAAFDDLFDKE